MINLVLERLEALQSELARLDPAREIDAAAQVNAMVLALRDVAAEARTNRRHHANPASGERIRAAG